MRRFLFLIFLIPVAISCLETPDCVNRRNDVVGIKFKSMNTNADTTVTIDSLAAKGMVLSFAPPGQVSGIILPLDYFNDTTFYFMKVSDTVYQLTLTYDVHAQYITDNCGERFELSNLTVAEHPFDSTNVINPRPGVDATANNIQFFR